jgi:hypothetical protein
MKTIRNISRIILLYVVFITLLTSIGVAFGETYAAFRFALGCALVFTIVAGFFVIVIHVLDKME